MNSAEEAYLVEVLAPLRYAGIVAKVDFENLNLRLAPKTWYRVDFLVTLADGAMECHEVKAIRKDKRTGLYKPHWEDDARVKFKLAAELWPQFLFRAVWKDGQGVWREEIRP